MSDYLEFCTDYSILDATDENIKAVKAVCDAWAFVSDTLCHMDKTLTPVEMRTLKALTAEKYKIGPYAITPLFQVEGLCDFKWRVLPWGVQVYSGVKEYAGPFAAARLIQAIMRATKDPRVITLPYVERSSKMESGSFGGGVCAITAKTVFCLDAEKVVYRLMRKYIDSADVIQALENLMAD